MTTHARALFFVLLVLGAALLPHAVSSQDLAGYRDFRLRSDLATVAALAGMSPSDVNTLHERPALLQDLSWRPTRRAAGSGPVDSAEQIAFSFHDNELFRVVVDYGYDQTEGMTDVDVVEAISGVYGPPLTGEDVPQAASRVGVDSGAPVAHWGDTHYAVTLYRRSLYHPTFRLVITDPAIEDMARRAVSEAIRLDEQEAPARERARQQKAQDEDRATADKARLLNKRSFQP